MKIITGTTVFLLLALAATVGVVGASGQKDSRKKKSSQASSSSSTATKSRARRVHPNSSGEPAPPTSQANAPKAVEPSNNNSIKPKDAADTETEKQAEQAGARATEKPVDKPSEKPADAKPLVTTADTKETNASPDSLISLREQIEAAPNGPERIRLKLKLAEQLSAADKKPEAIAELHAIINTDVFDPQGFYNGGNALARLGDSAAAINAYRKAIEQRKGNYSRALNNLGVVLMREGRWDEAHDALLSALKLESFRYAEASYNLGRLYSARGESDLAIREWRRTLTIEPMHTAAAQALSRAGSDGRVVERPEGSAKGPGSTKNINKLPETSVESTVASKRSGNSSANPAGPKVLTVDAVTFTFLQRARDLSEHGKLQEAVENYQRVLSRSGGYLSPVNLELSYVLMKLKRNDEALANLLQVTNRDGARYPFSHYYLARLYEWKGNLILAEQSFARAAMLYKAKPNVFLLDLSRVRERRGDFRGALAAMEEYVAAMEQQGIKLSWSDEKLSALRGKAAAAPKQ